MKKYFLVLVTGLLAMTTARAASIVTDDGFTINFTVNGELATITSITDPAEDDFLNSGGLYEFTIPDSITDNGNSYKVYSLDLSTSIQNLNNVWSLTIPATVEMIDGDIPTNLFKVTFLGEYPPMFNNQTWVTQNKVSTCYYIPLQYYDQWIARFTANNIFEGDSIDNYVILPIENIIDGVHYVLNPETQIAYVQGRPRNGFLYSSEIYSGNIVIPESVTYDNVTYTVNEIGEYAFYNQSQMTSLDIPATINKIGRYALNTQSNVGWPITSVYCRATVPPTVSTGEEDSFKPSICFQSTLYVPEGSVEAYEAAEGWTDFRMILPIGKQVAKVDNLWYILNEDLTAMVIGSMDGEYSGDILVPATITYNNKDYTVTEVGDGAFEEMQSAITSVNLPATIVKIGKSAFSCYYSYDSTPVTLTINATTPPAALYSEEDPYQTFPEEYTAKAILYVPGKSFDAYYTTKPWSLFNNINNIPDSRIKVTDVVATVDLNEYVGYGKTTQRVKFTMAEGSIAYANEEMSRWQKKDAETGEWTWCPVDSTFTEGIYRVGAQVRVDGEYGTTHVLDHDFTFTVNGEPWETQFSTIADTYSYGFAYSPEIEVTRPEPIYVTSGYVEYIIDTVDGVAQVIGLNSECPDNVDIIIEPNVFDPNYTASYDVTAIAEFAFSRTNKMHSVTIPASVKSIGANAFLIEENLAQIICEGTEPASALENAATPVAEEGTFSQWCFDNVELVVPAEGESAYRTTAPWSKFATITPVVGPKYVVADGIRYLLDMRDDGTPIATAVEVVEPTEYMFVNAEVVDETTGTEHTVVALGDWLFAQRYGILEVVLPGTIETIGNGTFYGISSLEAIAIDTKVPPTALAANEAEGVYGSFDEHCFTNIFLIVPSKSAAIKYNETAPWSSFNHIVYRMGNDDMAFESNEDNTVEVAANPGVDYEGDVVIPSTVSDEEGNEYTVSSIGDEAFAGQTGMTSVTIPETIESLGSNVFDGCTGLTEINCTSPVPPTAITGSTPTEIRPLSVTIGATFNQWCYDNVALNVPIGSSNNYATVEPWCYFVTINEKDFSGATLIPVDDSNITVEKGKLNANGNYVSVYDMTGRLVYSGNASVSLQRGIYIVKDGNKNVKVRL